MEVNATFYHPMGGDKSRRWLAETADEFTFVVKAFGGWTHRAKIPGGEDLRMFREIVDPLLEAGRLEGVLAQYPPSYHARRDSLPDLTSIRRLVAAVSPCRLFVEVRDSSLYRPDFLRFLEDNECGFVNVDLPSWRSLPGPSTINTGPVSYLRLHGRSLSGWSNPSASRDERYDYSYLDQEVTEIVTAIRTLASRTPRVLVAANNHFRAQAPATLMAVKSEYEGRPVPAPSRLIEAYPALRSRVVPAPELADDLWR